MTADNDELQTQLRDMIISHELSMQLTTGVLPALHGCSTMSTFTFTTDHSMRQPASALEGLPTAVLREVTSNLLLHDKRSLWLTSTDMYAKRDLTPHVSEKDRVWFAETAVTALWRAHPACSVMVHFDKVPGKVVLLTFDEGVCSVELFQLAECYDCGHSRSGKYGRFSFQAPIVLVSKYTRLKEQVLLWFAASPNDPVTAVHSPWPGLGRG